MKIFISSFLILLLTLTTCVAQIGDSRADSDIIFNDLTRKYFKDKRYANVEGTPYLFDEWKTATLEFNNGTRYEGLKLKFDLVSQDLIVLNSQNIEMVAPKANVKQFELTDAKEKLIFKSGYPAVENKTVSTIYCQLFDGKIALLRFLQKGIVQRDEFDKRKSFLLYEDFYIFYNGSMTLIRNKNSFAKILPLQSAEINTYITQNKLKLRDENDLKNLMGFINTLL